MMTKIQNPVLPGFNPDPSFVRAGEDYYIATSTFEWFPGVCIHHSKDLQNWKIVSYALTDETKFNMMGIDSACGVWAPNLTYDNGVFYLIYTIVYTNRHRFKDTHNFLVKATDVKGPWSEPVPLNKAGFDPSLFHDPNGKKWLVNMLFDYRLDHKRFGGVGIQEYDAANQTLIGEEYNIFRGSDIGTTEGPNIFYHSGYYYLVTAEGGTAFNHCVTMCRAKEITGPYEICPNNPVLTSRGQEGALLERAGHGQFVQAADGEWFMAHLCSRTVEGCSILGRETAIQNVTYTEDGWFHISGNEHAFPEEYFESGKEAHQQIRREGYVDFSNGVIPLDYMTLRQSAAACGIAAEGGVLTIRGGNSLSSKYNQGFLARRQQHFSYDFTALMEFTPRSYRHMAGIACYYNYDNYFYLYLTCDDDGKTFLQMLTSENKAMAQSEKVYLETGGRKLYLKAEVRVKELQFFYSQDGEVYRPVGDVCDMRMLSDERIDGNGFTGAMVGVCCQDLFGDGGCAGFEWVCYDGL